MLLEDGIGCQKPEVDKQNISSSHSLLEVQQNIIPVYEGHYNTPLDWRSSSVSYPKVLAAIAAESPTSISISVTLSA